MRDFSNSMDKSRDAHQNDEKPTSRHTLDPARHVNTDKLPRANYVLCPLYFPTPETRHLPYRPQIGAVR